MVVPHLIVGNDDGRPVGGGAQHTGVQPEPIVIHLLWSGVEYSCIPPLLYDLAVVPWELSFIVEVSLVQNHQRLDPGLRRNGMREAFPHEVLHNAVDLRPLQFAPFVHALVREPNIRAILQFATQRPGLYASAVHSPNAVPGRRLCV